MAKLLAIVFGLCAVLFMVCAMPYEEGEQPEETTAAAATTKDPISGAMTQPAGYTAPPTEMPSQNASYTMPPAAPPSQNQTAPGYTMPPMGR